MRRHLANEPVSAGPPGTRYKIGKFVRRHVVAVGSAVAVTLALLVFTGVLAFQARRLAAERDRANQEAATATQVTQFLISLFNVSDPGEARGNSLTARELLDTGAQQLASTLRDQPLVRARMGTTIGTVYTNLGLYASAEPLLEQALGLAREAGGDTDPQTIAALDALAAVVWYKGDYQRSAELYGQVVAARRATLGDAHRATLKAQYDLSSAYQGVGRLQDAEALLRTTLEQQRAAFGDGDLDTLASLNNLQALYYQAKRYQEALPLAEQVQQGEARVLGPDHPKSLSSLHNLGTVHQKLGHFEQAEAMLRRALDGRRRVLGPHHPSTIRTWDYVASALLAQDRPAEAASEYEALVREVGDESKPPYASFRKTALEALATIAAHRGDAAAADKWRHALEVASAPR